MIIKIKKTTVCLGNVGVVLLTVLCSIGQCDFMLYSYTRSALLPYRQSTDIQRDHTWQVPQDGSFPMRQLKVDKNHPEIVWSQTGWQFLLLPGRHLQHCEVEWLFLWQR